MSIQLERHSLEHLMVLRGKNLSGLLQNLEGSVPSLFHYQKLDNKGFIANLGAEEFLINHAGFNRDQLEPQQYAFQRGDVVISISGKWQELLSEVCIYDFRQARPGEFLMVLIAGVSVWMLIPEATEALIIGCDPTYGDYLFETLEKQINTSPFLNYGVLNDFRRS